MGTALAITLGCAPAPRRVAQQFVDAYYVETRLDRALSLTIGAAHDRVADTIRGLGTVPQSTDARPTLGWRILDEQVGHERARFVFRLSSRIEGKIQRSLRTFITVRKQPDGRWFVTGFAEKSSVR